ncbi:IclR family transcriptional regulator [Klebsiella quasivariicola]|uniref:IclR family transcriptional regulator n=1 Tax=Klebsiella quasivariicola TaxID=2026240 RepID=UPI002478A633|nr:IclR family transcriptional regulator [Klebsiella quasivariicola]
MKPEQRGIQSVEVAGHILRVMVEKSKPLSLTEIAELVDSAPAQIFTYLVSLERTGLLKRDPVTQKYEPGSLSLRLGLNALYDAPKVKEAIAAIERLGQQQKVNVFVSVWTRFGPVVIFYREYGMVMNLGFKQGSVFSLIRTATGKLFAAYMPRAKCDEIIQQQTFTRDDPTLFNSAEFQQTLAEIRLRGLSVSQSVPTPSVSALAAPVLDGDGNILLAISAFSSSNKLDNQNLMTLGDLLQMEARALCGETQ